MAMSYFLAFIGTSAPQQPIDPATFPVVLRRGTQHPPFDEPVPEWKAMSEDSLGTVVASSTVYSSDSLEEIVTMLAGAGFKKVSIDMGTVPIPAHHADDYLDDCPF